MRGSCGAAATATAMAGAVGASGVLVGVAEVGCGVELGTGVPVDAGVRVDAGVTPGVTGVLVAVAVDVLVGAAAKTTTVPDMPCPPAAP